MISFEGFSVKNDTPIYLQILDHIKRGMVSGAVKNGDELPSRRVLSALLGVNPNTVQKAYRTLEDEGLIESRLGAGSCVLLSSSKLSDLKDELIEEDARGAVARLKEMGLSKAEAVMLIEKHWDGGN